MDAFEFCKTMREICAKCKGCGDCPLATVHGTCDITDGSCDHSMLVAAVERWTMDHQDEDEAEEASDLHRAIALLSDKVLKLEKTAEATRSIIEHHGAMLNGYEAESRELREAQRKLADRIAALEKEPVESMNTPKPIRMRMDVLADAFPDAEIVDGYPTFCPKLFEKKYHCRAGGASIPCDNCKREYWLAEAEE